MLEFGGRALELGFMAWDDKDGLEPPCCFVSSDHSCDSFSSLLWSGNVECPMSKYMPSLSNNVLLNQHAWLHRRWKQIRLLQENVAKNHG